MKTYQEIEAYLNGGDNGSVKKAVAVVVSGFTPLTFKLSATNKYVRVEGLSTNMEFTREEAMKTAAALLYYAQQV